MSISELDHARTQVKDGRRGMRRGTWRIAVAAVLAALSAVLVVQGPAYAVGCKYSSCTGKNPTTEGCGADARNLEDITYNGIRVELRYSPACGAAWARGTVSSANIIVGQKVAIAAYNCTAATDACWKGQYTSAYILQKGEQAYTKMWTYGDTVRACKVWDDFDGQPQRRYGACTARH